MQMFQEIEYQSIYGMNKMKFFIICIIAGLVIGVCHEQINDIFSDKSIKDPTYEKMMSFILQDQTNYNTYSFTDYVCEDFSNDVVANAKEQKIRAGIVYLDEPVGYGHAIVCFDTTDRGLYFLEPQLDIVFNEQRMDSMISNGVYDIDVSYSDGSGEYFYMSLSGYSIEKWNNDFI